MSGTGPQRSLRLVGALDDFDVGVCRVIDVDGLSIGVVRTEDGGVYAIRNRCPHQGAEICRGLVTGTMVPSQPDEFVYARVGQVVVCPWHRWEFDLATGASIGQATSKHLRTYEAQVTDGSVYVLLPVRPDRKS